MTQNNDDQDVKIRADYVAGVGVEWGLRAVESPSDCDAQDAADALREAADKIEIMGAE